MFNSHKLFRGIVTVMLFVCFLFGVSLIPTLWLKTKNMSELNGYWVNVYYDNEEAAALGA